MGLGSVILMYLDPKAAALCKMMLNNGYYPVQGYARSPFSVPIDNQ